MTGRAPILRSIVLWVPDWPIVALLRMGRSFPADAPIALIEKGLVFACSAAARAEGVKRGIRVREAQARCPELIVQPYDPLLDLRAFETVVTEIEQLVSGVALLRPGVCALRVRGPARFYGGEKPAALALTGLLDQLRVPSARVGIADGPFTAEQAARSATAARRVRVIPEGTSAEFLAPLPIGLIELPALVVLLRRLGVTTLGEFAALAASDVLGRFGDAGAHLHALAGGSDSHPLTPRIPPEELDVQVAFEPPLDRVDQVTFGVRTAADDFVQALVAHKLVCTGLRVEIDTELGDYSERSWLHPRSFSASDVVDRVRWQLQGSGQVDAGLRSAVTAVRIVPESVDAIGNHEVGLFGAGPDERIHSGLSRVQSMVGHAGVVTAVVSGGRSLADRQQIVPWGDRPLLVRSPTQPWPGQLPKPAPATVFSAPLPVHVAGAGGEAIEVDARGALSVAPARFSPTASGRDSRRIEAWAGPWPITERWWDADGARRADRFQVIDSDGIAWLLVLEAGSWSAEARYD